MQAPNPRADCPSQKSIAFGAAGRITEEIENAVRMTGKNPVLGKLFRSAIHLSPERLNRIVEEIEAELKDSERSKKQIKEND